MTGRFDSNASAFFKNAAIFFLRTIIFLKKIMVFYLNVIKDQILNKTERCFILLETK